MYIICIYYIYVLGIPIYNKENVLFNLYFHLGQIVNNGFKEIYLINFYKLLKKFVDTHFYSSQSSWSLGIKIVHI